MRGILPRFLQEILAYVIWLGPLTVTVYWIFFSSIHWPTPAHMWFAAILAIGLTGMFYNLTLWNTVAYTHSSLLPTMAYSKFKVNSIRSHLPAVYNIGYCAMSIPMIFFSYFSFSSATVLTRKVGALAILGALVIPAILWSFYLGSVTFVESYQVTQGQYVRYSFGRPIREFCVGDIERVVYDVNPISQRAASKVRRRQKENNEPLLGKSTCGYPERITVYGRGVERTLFGNVRRKNGSEFQELQDIIPIIHMADQQIQEVLSWFSDAGVPVETNKS